MGPLPKRARVVVPVLSLLMTGDWLLGLGCEVCEPLVLKPLNSYHAPAVTRLTSSDSYFGSLKLFGDGSLRVLTMSPCSHTQRLHLMLSQGGANRCWPDVLASFQMFTPLAKNQATSPVRQLQRMALRWLRSGARVRRFCVARPPTLWCTCPPLQLAPIVAEERRPPAIPPAGLPRT